MTDFQSVTANEYDPGSPMNVALWSRVVNNPLAMFAGEPSAPRLQLNALPRIAAGGSARFSAAGASATTGTAFVTAFRWRSAQTGTIRVRLVHSTSATSSGIVEVLRNLVVVASWSHQSTNGVQRVSDISISRDDQIDIRHRQTTSGATSASTVSGVQLQTSGAWLLPVPPAITPAQPDWRFY